ncbi:MAG: hypothetical protein H7A21_16675 [Spirochaetales bacterium]|nr:hypothetical protein [Leptospiraceae bacterium]MCP5483073.1 hypothetical protein [Spirochaetales bacterium]MCP5486119.1 hypothetical protein [Spirochaetales bacterium]
MHALIVAALLVNLTTVVAMAGGFWLMRSGASSAVALILLTIPLFMASIVLGALAIGRKSIPLGHRVAAIVAPFVLPVGFALVAALLA